MHRLYRPLRLRQYGDFFDRQGHPRLARLLRSPPILAVLWRLHVGATSLREIVRRRSSHPRLGLVRQLRDVLRFTLEYRVKPDCYYRYRLYENWPARAEYLYEDELYVVAPLVNRQICPADADAIRDKLEFTRRCRDAGLPVAPILAVFRDGEMERRTADPAVYQADLFSKFSDQSSGVGAALWRHDGGVYRGKQGTFDFEGLCRRLATQSREHPVLLQPRLRNHVDLVPIAGQGLATVRAVTGKLGNREPEVGIAVYRMAQGAGITDHFDRGGLGAPIDLASGVLGSATGHRIAQEVARLPLHPDSGAAIEGRRLPYWSEVKALTLAAHRVFGTMPSIGWDIAITDDGPVLLEGNSSWALEILQRSHDMPLGRCRLLAACVCEAFREAVRRETA